MRVEFGLVFIMQEYLPQVAQILQHIRSKQTHAPTFCEDCGGYYLLLPTFDLANNNLILPIIKIINLSAGYDIKLHPIVKI